MSKTNPSWLGRSWRLFKSLLVVVFVVSHLTILIYRNVSDLWGEELIAYSKPRMDYAKIEPDLDEFGRGTRRYVSYLGIEQGWCMFGSPLARRALFPAVRIDFTDGSEEWMHSGNEPKPENFRRFGGWRQRKLEDTIAKWAADDDCKGTEATLWTNYTFWMYHNWRQTHPDDSREMKWLVLYRRRILFPEPGQPHVYPPADRWYITYYTPDRRREP